MTTAQRPGGSPGRRWTRALVAGSMTLGLAVPLSAVTAPGAGAVEGETWTDDFGSTTLHPEWEITNEDSAAWSLGDGVLRITGQTGDTYQDVNSARNVFMVDIPAGDFTAEVTVRAPVAGTYQGAGLIAWQDMDNYVRSGLTYVGSLSPSGIAIENDIETAAAFSAVSFTDRPASTGETLQLQRTGDTLTTRYRDASGAWTDASSVTAAFPTTQVGIYALGALDGTTLDATFDDFRVTAAEGRDIQPDGTFALRQSGTGAHLAETEAGLALTPDQPLSPLSFTATARSDGSVHLHSTDGDRPVVADNGTLALGQSGDPATALRLTDAGGGELYLRDEAGTGYAGGGNPLVLGAEADAVRFRLNQVSTSSADLTIDGDASAAQISDTMFGIFYEDINYAADGGLYAELVRNRSFEFNSSDNASFTGMTGWQLVNGGGQAPEALVVDDDGRLNELNRNYFRLVADGPGDGLRNLGYNNGFALQAGAEYDASLWARSTTAQPLAIRLENADGSAVHAAAEAALDGSGTWRKYEVTLTANATTDAARLVVTSGAASEIGLDMISVMPRDRWVGPVNGRSVLRKDLAEHIAAAKPAFLRFPGGCVTNVGTFRTYQESGYQDRRRTYQWKETIGPVEERPTNWNFWGYNQSYGIGYLEYFKFAEDLGAEPLPVVSVGANGCGSTIPEMHDPEMIARWVDDTLDLIEFANGDTTTEWGAKRAALGHPEPFGLEMIGLGNEENTTTFEANFPAFRDAIEAEYPEITIISNSGPDDSGARFDTLWDYNRRQNVDMVDEHYYNDPAWFLLNNHRYDAYDRNGPKVFLGEYASRGNTFYNALAEAAYMTGLQRNADVVRLASYAPLLSNESYVQWSPDAIWFDNDESWTTPNWEVQKLFGNNPGDEVVPSTFTGTVNQGVVQGGVFLSTWNTAAAYDNVRVTSNATGETLFSDGFSDASGWNPVAGSWAVTDGEYVQSSDTTTDARSVITDGYTKDWTNYTLELDARKISGSEGFLIGFAAQGGNDYYWWNIGGWNNTRSVLQRAQGGSAAEVKAVEGTGVETGVTNKVKIVVAGNTISLYLNDELHMTHEAADNEKLFQVVTRDKATGDLVAKVVNTSAETVRTRVEVSDVAVEPSGEIIQMTASSLTDTNTKADPTNVMPVTRQIDGLSNSFDYDFPPQSVTFLRMHTADGTAPAVDDVTVAGTAVNGWYADPVTVSATASDDRELDRIEFRVDGGDWVARPPAEASVQVGGNGPHTVEVRAVDAAGNTGELRPVGFGIDSAAPVSNATVDAEARTVTVRAADSGSGVERIETRTGTSGDWQPYTGPVVVGDAETTVQFRAVDRLGNAEQPGTVVVPAHRAELTGTMTTVWPGKVKAERGEAVELTVRVMGADGGPAPTGEVRVLEGGEPLASGMLTDGTATVSLDTTVLTRGTYRLVVRYLGDGDHKPSQTSLKLRVTKPKKD
ncbi:alpha-L-arabinofuranosidase C-terminal domain-containing protein [Streptomyces aidingensis]|uniref:non-reducing end alpha-L-arabinofuranosidase n=1 Tax=Streptomyces aidingensis TaxID=910347 RepID=A0A1I1UM16_9ACTN|nr:alpha-L-arabinofuranosidase C-terminal domain-containing protein [Streptomyces aidingensis]SFD71902.1 Alpha-L-arabinofuranosidase [Streptomyces aidingensis]